MDYKDFTPKQKAYDKFIKYRKEILNSENNGSFFEEFTELCTKAMEGDCVAQDCVAYFFNKGVPDMLPPNYDYYMSWEILAGANGNEFALEKLAFFLDRGMNEIIYTEGLLTEAMVQKNLNKDNAIQVIGNLLCEGIVDELGLDGKKLINIDKKPNLFSPEKLRRYSIALDNCLQRVAEFLIS